MKLGIYIFDQVEVLDFAGPFEVFSTAARLGAQLDVCTIAATHQPIVARGQLQVLPQHDFSSAPDLDILLIPGGVVTEQQQNPLVLNWIQQQAKQCQQLATVCTGIFILASAGLVTQHSVTTHWEDIDDLRQQFPSLNVRSEQRWVEDGQVISSAGISAGIDMSLHLLSKLTDLAFAKKTARQMEYHWQP